MQPATSPAAQRYQSLLGRGFQVVEFAQTTHTAADAAAAVGCAVGQIAKSLVFRTAVGGRDAGGEPVLVVASGANRVDERKLAALLGEAVARADADWVRETTGYAIGGIPPTGHRTRPRVLLDRDLQGYDAIWAAAGTPNAVFRLTPADLERVTGGTWAEVSKQTVRPASAQQQQQQQQRPAAAAPLAPPSAAAAVAE